jgi:hypothetical protein
MRILIGTFGAIVVVIASADVVAKSIRDHARLSGHRETERCRIAQATAPILDSTVSDLLACPLNGRYRGESRHGVDSPFR